MKISYNWLREFLPPIPEPGRVAELLTQAGLEVTQLTPFQPMPASLLIGEVVSCLPHPNADKLKLTQVDLGKGRQVQIVCGAANVAAGQKVVVASEGTVLTLSDGSKLKIRKAKIRGEHSEGMICSASEIGLSQEGEGILVVDTERPAGTSATTCFSAAPDYILEIEVTPNRGDALSHLGVARELAALLDKQLEPMVAVPVIPSGELSISVEVEDERCLRYIGVVLQGVQIGTSPVWLQNKLRAIGVKPVNNLVDITQLVMYGWGQPLHAFDYDAIAGGKLRVAPLAPQTPFKALDGTTYQLEGHEMMISDGQGPLCMAGVIGGERGKVTSATRNVFLESACFAPEAVWQAAHQHQIHTAAAYRYARGTDIEMPVLALQKAVTLVSRLTEGAPASPIYEHHLAARVRPTTIEVRYDYLERLIGMPFSPLLVQSVLRRLDMPVNLGQTDSESFVVTVPPYRVGIERPADVAEEILRIHGYDQVEARLPKAPLPNGERKPRTEQQTLLLAHGFHEIQTSSLVDGELLQASDKAPVFLANPFSKLANALRPTLLFSGLEVVAHNLHHGIREIKLFEEGRIYYKKEGSYHEPARLGLWLAGSMTAPHWLQAAREASFYDLHGMVVQWLTWQGIEGQEMEPVSHPYYAAAVQLSAADKRLGIMGEVHPRIRQHYGIRQPVFFAELAREDSSGALTKRYIPFPQVPAVERDISFLLDAAVTFDAILKALQQDLVLSGVACSLVDSYQGAGVPEGKKSYTLRFTFQGKETMEDKHIRFLTERVTSLLYEQLGLTPRD